MGADPATPGRRAPSRSLEILYQRLLTRFGWGMALLSGLQIVTRALDPPSPWRLPLVLSATVALPVWILLTARLRANPPDKDRSDAFAFTGAAFVMLQLTLVTVLVRDPMRLAAHFTLLGLVGVFVRRRRTFLAALSLILVGIAVTWHLAPPPAASARWMATQLAFATMVGLLVHQLMRTLLYRVGYLLHRLMEARRAVKELRDLIPICAACKRMRNDTGYWETVESYLERHTQAALTHGLCPTCLAAAREELRQDRTHRSGAPDPGPDQPGMPPNRPSS